MRARFESLFERVNFVHKLSPHHPFLLMCTNEYEQNGHQRKDKIQPTVFQKKPTYHALKRWISNLR